MSDMLSVETTGDFMLFDVQAGAYIEADGFTDVAPTSFVMDKIEAGLLREAKAAPAPASTPAKK